QECERNGALPDRESAPARRRLPPLIQGHIRRLCLAEAVRPWHLDHFILLRSVFARKMRLRPRFDNSGKSGGIIEQTRIIRVAHGIGLRLAPRPWGAMGAGAPALNG